MFVQESLKIDRPVSEIYAFLSSLKTQLPCWESLMIPEIASLSDSDDNTRGFFSIAGKKVECIVELYRTRPGAGCVTKVLWSSGEVAAEWRVIDDLGKTRVELTLEGNGGGLASSGNMRNMARLILNRIKSRFEIA